MMRAALQSLYSLLSQPKFTPGQLVAVCANTPPKQLVVIPMTRVVSIQLHVKGEVVTTADGVKRRFGYTGYWYTVEGDMPRRWFAESALRPIRPDEYQETNSKQSLNQDAGATCNNANKNPQDAVKGAEKATFDRSLRQKVLPLCERNRAAWSDVQVVDRAAESGRAPGDKSLVTQLPYGIHAFNFRLTDLRVGALSHHG